jgi:hypothetical protein
VRETHRTSLRAQSVIRCTALSKRQFPTIDPSKRLVVRSANDAERRQRRTEKQRRGRQQQSEEEKVLTRVESGYGRRP